MIQQQHFTLAIMMMAIITFSVRYAFFSGMIKIKLTPTIKNILTFTAPCVLTAMIMPIMFQDILPTPQTDPDILVQDCFLEFDLLHSSYFWAGIFSIIASLFIRQTLLVVVLSMLVFYGLRNFVF